MLRAEINCLPIIEPTKKAATKKLIGLAPGRQTKIKGTHATHARKDKFNGSAITVSKIALAAKAKKQKAQFLNFSAFK